MPPEQQRLIRRIVALCAALGVACAGVFAVFRGREAALSALTGALLGAGNIALMAWLVRVALDDARARWLRLLAGLLLPLKSFALLGLIAWLMLTDRVQMVAFLAGLLMLLVSIVLAALTQGDGDSSSSSGGGNQ